VTHRLSVLGTGYLGATHAVCMAEMGYEVIGMDVDQAKIDKLNNGEVPFFEPGLEPLLRKNMETGRLRFTTSYEEAGSFADVHFICVGTPQKKGEFAADMTYVNAVTHGILPYTKDGDLLVGKSTVPVGTAERLTAEVNANAPAGAHLELAWNPEFLREGHAVPNSLTPDRFVFSVTSEAAAALLRRVYAKPLAQDTPALVTDLETAELVKVAANAFLASKISFINAMAEVCEAAGADVTRLAEALGHDERIGGKFLGPGLGFGGGCLPKDIRAFRATAAKLGVHSTPTPGRKPAGQSGSSDGHER
jgi:nucleotide sugar dehydrogenase